MSARSSPSSCVYGSMNLRQKIQFAGGIGQREMLRADTLPSLTRARVCKTILQLFFFFFAAEFK